MVRGSRIGTNLTPGAFDELIKMLTDLKSEIVASKTEDTADAFDQVCRLKIISDEHF